MYGHYVSQPSRSVAWLLKLNEQQFKFVKVDVMKGEARSDAYKAKFPTCLIPGLEDGEFCLAEVSAIMQYLCEKYGWNQWWPIANDPASRQKRARIAEFLSSHHHTTRLISHKLVRPLFMAGGKLISAEVKDSNMKAANKILKRFEAAFLKSGSYVNGMTEPTIADLVAYSEIGQLIHFDIIPSFNDYPLVKQWAGRMSQLPHYEDVHKSNKKLGAMLRTPM